MLEILRDETMLTAQGPIRLLKGERYREAQLGDAAVASLLGRGFAKRLDPKPAPSPLPTPAPVDLSTLTVKELKALADAQGLSYPASILKADLLALLTDGNHA